MADATSVSEQIALDLGLRWCRCCKRQLLLSEFTISRNRKDGLKPYCRGCCRDKQRDLYMRSETARQKKSEKFKRWRLKNREKQAERYKAWCEANPERKRELKQAWHLANVEQQRAQFKAWRAAHPHAASLYAATRRTRLVSTVPFTPAQLAQRWAYYGNKCWICGDTATVTDHVKPVSKGGAHMLCNLRPSCATCNLRKHAVWPFSPEMIRRD